VQVICIWSSWFHYHPIVSYFIKIQTGLTFLMPAYPGCPGKEAVSRVSVYQVIYHSFDSNLFQHYIALKFMQLAIHNVVVSIANFQNFLSTKYKNCQYSQSWTTDTFLCSEWKVIKSEHFEVSTAYSAFIYLWVKQNKLSILYCSLPTQKFGRAKSHFYWNTAATFAWWHSRYQQSHI